MLIRMRYQISGTRNGQPWPAPGGEIELPDDEAVILLRTQMAEAIEDKQEPETAEAPKTETTREESAPEEPKKAPAKRGRPRKTATKVVDR